MSFDRVDPYSAGFGRQGPQRPAAPPGFAGKKPPQDKPLELGVPLAGAASHSFMKDWGQNILAYGSHNVAAEAINRAASADNAVGRKVQSWRETSAAKLGFNPAAVDVEKAAPKAAMSYSELLRLDNKQTPLSRFSWDSYASNTKSNLQDARHWAKPENIKNYFSHTNLSDYAKRTVVAGNAQPIKELATNPENKDIGTGVFRTIGMSVLGYDVIKHTYQAYKTNKAQEDGSFKSKLHTYKEASKAFGKYFTRDGTSWEVAGLGAAVGKAILPLAIGGVSVGGVVIGALAGLLAEKGMDKLLHTGKHDPMQPVQHKQQNEEIEDGNDGSRAGSVSGPVKR